VNQGDQQMTEPREAVQAPADAGRCSNPPTTEEIEQFWTQGVDALPPNPLNEQLRASIAQFPPSLRRLVDDEPPAQIFDPTLPGRVVADPPAQVCEYCGPVCYGGAEHFARMESGDRVDVTITPAGVAALAELAEQGRIIFQRAQLMASLIHASRNLAQERVGMVHTTDRGSAYYCRECQASIEPDPLRNAHEHHRSCKTGLVFVLLSELSKLPAEFGGAA
jgi:hypothetical protein